MSKKLFWDIEKIIQEYGIFGVIYYGIWEIGYPTKQASTVLTVVIFKTNVCVCHSSTKTAARRRLFTFEQEQDITYKITCAYSGDSD